MVGFSRTSSKFGQPTVTTKVTPEVATGDIERSPEAQQILRLVTEQSLLAAAHSSQAVIQYNASLVKGVSSVCRVALQHASATERATSSTGRWEMCGLFRPPAHTSPAE